VSGESLNDVVTDWGIANGAPTYNLAKDSLTASYTQDEVAVFGGATSWNEGLRNLASGLFLLALKSESGDTLLLESGDRILLEQV
jgi:hypothetical protein